VNVQRQVTEPHRIKLRVEDYLRLSEAGAFAGYAKTELIGGEIIGVNAQYSRHARAQRAMFLALYEACRALGLECVFELSITIDRHNEPRPDILVARSLPDRGPLSVADVLLVVEIADTSLETDLMVKAPLYAAAGLAEYWVIDRRVIHQMWAPEGVTYAERGEVAFQEMLEAATVAGLKVETKGLG
jgi:Uma2 family endonuclease